jgi:hypothetical protein
MRSQKADEIREGSKFKRARSSIALKKERKKERKKKRPGDEYELVVIPYTSRLQRPVELSTVPGKPQAIDIAI